MTFTSQSGGPGNHAVGDMDSDGYLDVCNGSGYQRNNGGNNKWLRVNLVGTLSNRDAIGARVTITSALGTQIRDIRSGDGFRYMSFIGAHFGLGNDEVIEELSIRWPHGEVEVFTDVPVNAPFTVVEGITTGLVEAAETSIALYPNPAMDAITIGNPGVNARYEVLDAAGKLVLEGSNANGRISVTELLPGAYLMRTTENGAVKQARFTKL
ncbi:MAG: ASPIC/UnbV domain-containing protein [Flavobacteriales bacterium]|nr:ASPIC/UnbV domain-containing protein [Flavobacteriales bacterium]